MSSKAQEELPAEYDGDDIVIGYNSEYLKDVINHINGKTVFIRLNTPISASLFSSEVDEDNVDNLMLLMPIRLNDWNSGRFLTPAFKNNLEMNESAGEHNQAVIDIKKLSNPSDSNPQIKNKVAWTDYLEKNAAHKPSHRKIFT